jgi:hypothetical protein
MRDIPNTKNIIKQKDGFYIRKYLNGKHTYLGMGSTLIIALMRLDWVKANNWKPYKPHYNYIQKRENGGYRIRKWLNNELQFLGEFETLEEAEKEVELLKKCNWDIEAVCNIDERKDNQTIFLGREIYE